MAQRRNHGGGDKKQQIQQREASGGVHASASSTRGGSSDTSARELLASVVSQHIPRRRIEFHPATRPDTVFATCGVIGGVGKSGNGSGVVGEVEMGAGLAREGGVATEGGEETLVSLGDQTIGLPPAETGLYPESSVKKLLGWRQVYRMGCGLYNMGNTCFLNATVQCLSYLPPLAQLLLQGVYSQGPEARASRGARPMGGGSNFEYRKVEIMAAMEQLTKQVHQGRGGDSKAIRPSVLVRNIGVIGRQFKIGRQEDAHEFLRHLLDSMVTSCLKRRGVKSSAPGRRAETTAINRIFGGYLRSQLKCLSCGHCSAKFDPFMDLSMELSEGVRSLDVALARFTAKERLEGQNKWRCGGCQKLVCAEKILTVFKLKRFVFARRAAKIRRHIEFNDKLELTVSGPERSAHYMLTGVVVHAGGSMSSGHYYAYVRSSSGTWAKMDDTCVSKVKQTTVLNDEAYVLFYTRRPEPVAPTSRNVPNVAPGARVGVSRELSFEPANGNGAGKAAVGLAADTGFKTGRVEKSGVVWGAVGGQGLGDRIRQPVPSKLIAPGGTTRASPSMAADVSSATSITAVNSGGAPASSGASKNNCNERGVALSSPALTPGLNGQRKTMNHRGGGRGETLVVGVTRGGGGGKEAFTGSSGGGGSIPAEGRTEKRRKRKLGKAAAMQGRSPGVGVVALGRATSAAIDGGASGPASDEARPMANGKASRSLRTGDAAGGAPAEGGPEVSGVGEDDERIRETKGKNRKTREQAAAVTAGQAQGRFDVSEKTEAAAVRESSSGHGDSKADGNAEHTVSTGTPTAATNAEEEVKGDNGGKRKKKKKKKRKKRKNKKKREAKDGDDEQEHVAEDQGPFGQAPLVTQFASEHRNNVTSVEGGSPEESHANSNGGGARKVDEVTGENKKGVFSFPMPVSLEKRDGFPSSGKRELVEVTGNQVAVAWRPAKRQKQELFGQSVGFWGDGEERKCRDDADGGGTHADEKALHRLASAKEEQAELMRASAVGDKRDLAARANSFWDRCLDMGKSKKVKARKEQVTSHARGNPFEARQREISCQPRRGHREERPYLCSEFDGSARRMGGGGRGGKRRGGAGREAVEGGVGSRDKGGQGRKEGVLDVDFL